MRVQWVRRAINLDIKLYQRQQLRQQSTEKADLPFGLASGLSCLECLGGLASVLLFRFLLGGLASGLFCARLGGGAGLELAQARRRGGLASGL